MGEGLFKLLFTILVFASCTVQKRLHQPGWNINFRGHWQKNHEKDAVANFDTSSIDKKLNFIEEQKLIQTAHKISLDSVNQVDFPNLKGNELKTLHKAYSIKPFHQVSKLVSIKNSENTYGKKKLLNYNSKRTNEVNRFALVFLSIGLVFCIIGLLIFLSADATIAGSFILLFGALGIVIGSIFFLFGLIILLINAVANNERRIKQPEESAIE